MAMELNPMEVWISGICEFICSAWLNFHNVVILGCMF